ncbi:hypothetical protein NA57DRAFT_61698 [Rhizodiscina lignyota]|uniref:Uncharacterized protein n=1 Tax=Rhizodiscina lignyota TaxID=1504668 RepID=A0A9P4M157_9PEZI|nr:hypothetical protein NA57DRAFT_61698 [Rhizodiscina lignyota]
MKCVFAIAALSAFVAAQSSDSASNSGNAGIPFPSPTIISTTFTDEAKFTSVEGRLLSDLSTWATSVTAQPEYSAFLSALSTAVPKSEFEELTATNVDIGVLSSLATAESTPTWWTKLPTSVQQYYTSLHAEELSIYTKDLSGPAAPTALPVLKAAGVAAAGALAGAALLL